MIAKNMFSAVSVALFALLTYNFVGPQTEIEPMKPGEKVKLPTHSMTDVSGESFSLDDAAGDNGLLVIFNSNLCPFVIGNGTKSEGWEGRYTEIYRMAEELGVGMALINSNKALRNKGDGMDDMREQSKRIGYEGLHLLDRDHVLADAFGALVTPHVFLFNADKVLVYTGTVDDNVNDSKAVKSPYLKDALRAMEKGVAPEPAVTRHLGCSIKRVKS